MLPGDGHASPWGPQDRVSEPIVCVECFASPDPLWLGWRGCRIDDPYAGDEPEVAFFCPTCAFREFG